jgi:D-lyxose ketol-isomerase
MSPNLYHAFWAKKGEGTLVCGEVSSINDDNIDNRFHSPMPRYAEIEEDQPPRYVLCNEYEKLLS